MSRTSLIALAFATVSLAASGAAHALIDTGPKPGTAGIELGRPRPYNAVAEHRLEALMRPIAVSCVTASRQPSNPDELGMLDADAAVGCAPRLTGPTSVSAQSYPDRTKLDARFDEWIASYDRRGGCDGANGRTSWATREGTVRGQILCIAGTTDTLVWSDRSTRVLYRADMPDSESDRLHELIAWWQRGVRPHTADSRLRERQLRGRVEARWGGSCNRADADGAPTAIVSLFCSGLHIHGREYLGSAYLQQLPTPESLHAYLTDGAADLQLPAATADACEERIVGTGPWHDATGSTEGTVQCYAFTLKPACDNPTEDCDAQVQRVIAWSRDRGLLFGYLTLSDDEGAYRDLLDAWHTVRGLDV